ncbi:MAG TPA: hypothetical protein VFS21_07910 [Roseiflexaceae bacterium]|nr:hypothetical protein [Roseiflexaceae bacterium]
MQTDTLRERGLRYWFGALARLAASVLFGGLGGTVLGIGLSLSYLSRRSAPNGMPLLESEHMLFTGALALLGGMTVGLLLTPQKMPQLRWLLLCAIANPIGMFLLIGTLTTEPEQPFRGRASIPAFDRLVVAGDQAYLISGSSTSYRIDVRDPRNPRVQDEAFGKNRPGDLSSAARDMQIVDGRGYIAAEGQGLVVLDMRDPARLALLGDSRAAGLALDGARVSVDGGLAALVWAGGLALLDVRDPARMALVAQTSSEDWQEPREVTLVGGWVYLLHQNGLAIIEHTPSGTLEQRAALPFKEGIRLQIVGQRAYVLASGKLHRLDISDPARPTQLSTIAEEGSITTVWVEETRVYLLTRSETLLKVVDLAGPGLPAVQAQYSLPYQSGGFGGSSPNLVVRDDVIYLIASARSLAVLDLRSGRPDHWAACVIYSRFWPKCAREPLPDQP